ncbi:MAG: Asp-tRNA(Asn)/Glu-tRNA(Gln) amidotransferase subunit GatC [bacterium]|jgi:aspartyl-tRNA(Asn)/glutamyl-tRNA(Gln) amidotransferase subunit C
MEISRKDVEQVATLARIEITEEEKEMFTQQLNVILEYIDQLNELDTEAVPPTFHVLPLQNILREDVVRPSLPQEKALGNAPETENGCFKVPKIL